MTGMELYVKFMFTLTVGLVGLSLVLITVLETLLAHWDPVVDIRRWWRQTTHHRSTVDAVRAEDILSELEGRRHGASARLYERPVDRRREALRQVNEAERRLSDPLADPLETV